MKSRIQKAFQFLLFSNIFISFCAVAQGILTYFLLDLEINHWVLSLLFFSTLLIYNIDRVIYSGQLLSSFMTERKEIINKYAVKLQFIAFVSAVCILFILFFLPLSVLLILIPLGILSIAYSVPILSNSWKIPALKYWYGQKAFIIATVWSLSSILIPITAGSVKIGVFELILMIVSRFFFIAVLSIQFDIRDIEQDKSNKWNTIPVLFGIKKANIICYLLITLFIITLSINSGFNNHYWGMLASASFTALVIYLGKFFRSENYYSFFMDGMLMLQPVLVIIFSNFI